VVVMVVVCKGSNPRGARSRLMSNARQTRIIIIIMIIIMIIVITHHYHHGLMVMEVVVCTSSPVPMWQPHGVGPSSILLIGFNMLMKPTLDVSST